MQDTDSAALYIAWMLQTKNEIRRELGFKRFERLLKTEELRQELQQLYDSVDLEEDLSEDIRKEYQTMFLVRLALPTLNYVNF